jgi:hypothetical protein
MSNDTTVSVSAVGGALAVVATFVAGQLGVELPAEVGAAVAVVVTATLGSLLPR